MTDDMKKIAAYAAMGIGVVLMLAGIIWGRVIGFYEHQRPIVLAFVIVGAGLALGGERVSKALKRKHVEQRIADRMIKEN